MFNARLAGDHLAVHLAVAGDVFDGVCPFSHEILNEIWN